VKKTGQTLIYHGKNSIKIFLLFNNNSGLEVKLKIDEDPGPTKISKNT